MKKYILVILLFEIFIAEGANFRFSHLTSKDGISQSEIYCFLEDSKGFMWIGSVDGLNRYDGYVVEVFNTKFNEPHSLAHNTIRSLAEDSYGRIWIGTDNGLNFFDTKTEAMYKVNVNSKLHLFSVWDLEIYENHLMIGSTDGLWRKSLSVDIEELINGDIHKVDNYSFMPQPDNLIRSIVKSKLGGLWIQTGSSLSRIFFENDSNIPIIVDDKTFPDQTSLVEDTLGNLWIGTAFQGLIKYNPISKESLFVNRKDDFFSSISKRCSALAIDKKGNLWIGTLDRGLILMTYDYGIDQVKEYESIQFNPSEPKGLNSDLIYSLFISQDDVLWVGTIGSAVNIYDPQQKKFKHHNLQNFCKNASKTNFVRSVCYDKDDNLLVGTHNSGLFSFDRTTGEFIKLGFSTNSVFYISKYVGNKYFVGTGEGLYLVEITQQSLKILDNANFFDNRAVFYITKSKTDIYWCATLNGLMRLIVKENKITLDVEYTTKSTPNISLNNCRVLYYDIERNKLFLGMEGGGVNVLNFNADHYPEEIDVYQKITDSLSISNNFIRSIKKDHENGIWVGTYDGLNKMVYNVETNRYEFKTFSTADGLPNNMIESIIVDRDNTLWIGTNGGLSNYTISENIFTNYFTVDGLQSNEFSEHTAIINDKNEIVFGGINGINIFYPEDIKLNHLKPKTTITDFYLFNKRVSPGDIISKSTPLEKSILVTDTIVLAPNSKNFGFNFSAMLYPNAIKIKYKYMLEGFDDTWNILDAGNRSVNYTNLKHGKYTFKIKSTNTDGVWEENPKELFIHILTPFKFTWFAYALYFFVTLLIILYFSHFTLIRYTTKKNLLLEKEHNKKLHNLDEMRTKFFINISHDLRTPLTLIRGPLEMIINDSRLSKDIRENLKLIKRNVKRLNYLIEQLLDVRKSETGKLVPKLKTLDIVNFAKKELSHFKYAIEKKGLRIDLSSKQNELYVPFDPGMISKVFFNILGNAIKFTEKGKINIVIEDVNKEETSILQDSLIKKFVKIEIRDTGIGMSEDKMVRIFDRFYQDKTSNGYGIGLSHSKELIDAHKGYIEAESKKELGTAITFYLPFTEMIEVVESSDTSSSIEDIYIDDESIPELEESTTVKSKPTVLVVEDNKDMLVYIKNGLKELYNVLLAEDGSLGYEIAEREVPDLIISDIIMSKMDGIELCKKIKTNIKVSHIPVILLTAKVDEETKYKGIELGADDFIAKPFNMKYLLVRIKNLLDSREQLRKVFQKTNSLEPSEITVTSIDEKFLKTLMEQIEKNVSDSSFSVNSLESQMGMSHSSFYRKIKSLTGQSGQELLQSIRMKRAHQILSENSDLRISEVAYMVGFTDPKYFARCYKDVYGYSPSRTRSGEDNIID